MLPLDVMILAHHGTQIFHLTASPGASLDFCFTLARGYDRHFVTMCWRAKSARAVVLCALVQAPLRDAVLSCYRAVGH